MNQILVTKKLYITPELKRKKKIYKLDFILSIFLVCILTSIYIYAEYDRNRSEETSQGILADMNDNTTVDDNILMVILSDENQEYASDNGGGTDSSADVTGGGTGSGNGTIQGTRGTTQGYGYATVGAINIPKINVNYPILAGDSGSAQETEAILKVAPCKFWGPNPNEVGNLCVVGHNYRNHRFFSKTLNLVMGDIVEITDLSGRTINYEVYNKYSVQPNDVSCTSQLTGGRKEVTLITCTNDSVQRVIIKCREVT